MKPFPRKLITEWRKMQLPMADAAIVVAVSGGADSTALLAALHELHALKKLKPNFIVAHFNHQLRATEADADENFVKNLAMQFNFEFVAGKPATPLRPNSNLEESARRARYDFLFNIAAQKSAVAVLTAHTLNDQAETFLLRLIRGSGADGLGAINQWRMTDGGLRIDNQELKTNLNQNSLSDNPQLKQSTIVLVRPLLGWARRAETEDYCRERELEFRVDAMNFDAKFARVRVRRELLPLLETLNPKIIETLANTADLLRDDVDELNAAAAEILTRLQSAVEINVLPVGSEFAELSGAVRRRVLRLWLMRERGDLRRIDAKHLRALDDLACRNVGGRTIELPNRAFVTRQAGKLFYHSEAAS